VAVQRRIALRVISAYRTVSGDAAAILAGLLPGDILAGSYRRAYLALRGAREVNPELTARARAKIRKRERRLAVNEWARLRDRGVASSGTSVRRSPDSGARRMVGGGGARRTYVPGHLAHNGARLIRGLPVQDWSG